ncbi:MAG: class I SAM-dependent methyltransferase [Lachnospiraceae bacterium]|nr:class I SAM-dependent methyltransferase [Lachnospiraceae bacterium]
MEEKVFADFSKAHLYNLSERLREVSKTVISCNKVADIGCDHGYVAISLIESGKINSALCMDINEGPLEAAKEHIRTAGYENVIETRLSNGLHNATAGDEIESIIVAGMGGNLVSTIIDEGSDIVKGLKQMVLQPQSELFLVRKKIRELGFYIDSEKFLIDMGKYYWIMDARPGKQECMEPNMQELYDNYSEFLIKSKDSLYKEYIENSIRINEGYLKGISDGNSASLNQKINDLKQVLNLMS